MTTDHQALYGVFKQFDAIDYATGVGALQCCLKTLNANIA